MIKLFLKKELSALPRILSCDQIVCLNIYHLLNRERVTQNETKY